MKESKSGGFITKKVSAAKSKHDFMVIGIGASAGGIKALKEFFAAMPADSGMAFVVILHLSQTHESSLAQILQNETQMRVEQVTETVKVEPDKVYVIPPAKGLAMVDGHIKLTEPERIKGRRVPIDLFFRTLADAYGKNGIAVVLSGTGSDGTLGLKRVKENGGIGIAQEPSEAEYDGMPQSAINTGLVDLVLPVGEMPARIIGLRETGEKILLPKEKDRISRPARGKEPDALQEILGLVKVRTGHDFSTYKQATVLRRIARRLQVHELTELPEYLVLLRVNPEEAGALQRDLLITVTNFFRDKEAFAVLEREIIPKLFAGKTSADTIRVWSVGCATGEEAYSLAILLDEYASRMTDAPKIQIFASDINDRAITAGRDCFYEETIIADVSPERLRHYFAKENGGYRIRKELREKVIFAPHNILRDPPFSRIDLITCRNLLIYFNRDTQGKVLEIFNFALQHDGFLFLGGSESAESASSLFSVIDKRHRIYKALPASQFHPLPVLPAPGKWHVNIPPRPVETSEVSPLPSSYGEIHVQLVEQFAPPSVLISEEYEVLHVSEHADRFLRATVGEPTRNLLKTVNPALKLDLQNALFEVKKNGAVSEARNVRLKIEGRETLVNITVRLLYRPDAGDIFYMVIFDESKSEAVPEEAGQAAQTIAGRNAVDGIVGRFEQELQLSRERLRATIEQHETSTEELKASNEELQAMNEELRSASEELETGREELQSLNEELHTLNAELKDKNEQLNYTNSDLQNLIQSTDIGTIFLDRGLRIKRFTPRVTEIFNLIPSDIGRPLEHITHRLKDDYLVEDAGSVLQTLHLKEREVRGGAGDKRYLVRLALYRTLDDKIDGVVLSFQDITDLKRAADALAESEERSAAIVNQNLAGIVKLDLNGKVVFTNDRFCETLGYTGEEMLEKQLGDFIHAQDLPESLARLEQLKNENQPFEIEKRLVRKDGSIIWVHNYDSPITDAYGKLQSVAIISVDITTRKQMEEALQKSEAEFRNLLEKLPAAAYTCNAEGLITYFNQRAVELWGRTPRLNDEANKFCGSYKLFYADGTPMPHDECWVALAIKEDQPYDDFEVVIEQPNGSHFNALVYSNPLHDASGKLTGAVNVLMDITERKQMEKAVQESEEKYRTLFNTIDEGFCTIEMIFDGGGKPRDFRFVESNPMFEKMTGLADSTGKTVLELVPNLEDFWIETYGKVALTGETVRFENYSEAMNRLFDVFASRIGDETSRKVAVVFTNITTRRRAEMNSVFLGEIVQELAGLTAIDEMMETVGAKIGAYLNLSACAFVEINDAAGEAIINHAWNREDVPDIVGVYRLSEYLTEDFQKAGRAGEMFVVNDTQTDSRTDAAQYATLKIGSFLSIPIIQDKEWRFLLVGYYSHPHDWQIDEIEFIRQLTTHIWTRLGRARAEEALREKEAELEAIVSETPFMLARCTRNFRYRYVSRAYAAMFNQSPEEIAGKPIIEIIGKKDFKTIAPHVERVLQGERVEFETEMNFRGEDEQFLHVVYTPDKNERGEVVGWIASIVDITERRRAEQTRREKETLQKMIGAQEEERRRIAQDLHDHLGQQLTALRLKIEILRGMCDDNEAMCERVEETQLLARQMDADLDFLAWEMRPTTLDDIGLAAALANFVREWSRHFNIPVDFRAGSFGKKRLAPEAETQLYRIAQEALNNVFKHAQATSVDVALESRAGYTVLIIEDNGIGFAPDKQKSGKMDAKRIGLSGMRERAALVSGTVEIESAPDTGTTVFVRVPVSRAGEEKKDE